MRMTSKKETELRTVPAGQLREMNEGLPRRAEKRRRGTEFLVVENLG
jgi:hypothetical protein